MSIYNCRELAVQGTGTQNMCIDGWGVMLLSLKGQCHCCRLEID